MLTSPSPQFKAMVSGLSNQSSLLWSHFLVITVDSRGISCLSF